MEKLVIGDDIGYYRDWRDADEIELIAAVAGGIPNAIAEARRRNLLGEIKAAPAT
jgi:pantothenate kinase-related protein Tda10